MKCKEAKVLLSMMADNELDQLTERKLLLHINSCKGCQEEYHMILNIKKRISDCIGVEDLSKMDLQLAKKKSKNWRNMYMKRKIIAASLALLLMTGLFIPVNGQSFADTIQQWVKSLSFTTQSTDYTITTDLDKIIVEEQNEEDTAILQAGHHAKANALSAEQQETSENYKTYESLAELQADLGYDIVQPQYIPDGYTQKDLVSYTFDEGMTNIATLRYYNLKIASDAPSLYVEYEYINKDIPKREIRMVEGTNIKQVSINELPAVISWDQPEGNHDFVGIDVMVDNGDFKMLRINMLVNKADTIDGIPANIEEELVKIAESVLMK